mgnify:CR=1 FL=1
MNENIQKFLDGEKVDLSLEELTEVVGILCQLHDTSWKAKAYADGDDSLGAELTDKELKRVLRYSRPRYSLEKQKRNKAARNT